MPEIKNTFLKSKMNKDLDARLVPNGEYRDAQNLSVSKSEGADVGSLENILGNTVLTDLKSKIGSLETDKLKNYFNTTAIRPNEIQTSQLEIIGYYSALSIDTIFLFITDYRDSSNNQLSNFASADAGDSLTIPGNFYYKGAMCYIAQYNLSTNVSRILVGGNFLNFSKTHPILNVNLLEDLLFWTDNRNQPRKININNASLTGSEKGSWESWSGSKTTNPYYYSEDHISVAKFAPYECFKFINSSDQNTLISNSEEFLPSHIITSVNANTGVGSDYIQITGNYVLSGNNPDIAGDNTPPYSNADRLTVNINDVYYNYLIKSVSTGSGNTGITLTETLNAQGLSTGITPSNCVILISRKNPEYNVSYRGDTNLLRDKFPKFSYRFKYDDGEYSLMAPFTQAAFVPKQFGYFINDDEQATLESGNVKFMENRVDEVKLNLTLPFAGDKLEEELKVKELQILIKNSDELAVRVIEDIEVSRLSTTTNYEYSYLSTKAIKTLPEADLIRVHDKIPVRALTQEIISNRVVYGNYLDKHTSPINLNYELNYNSKSIDPPNNKTAIEFPNHTVKQNRSYQVGVVLIDRYGRASNVILNNSDNVGTAKNSTIYADYVSETNPAFTNFFGKKLEFNLRSPIPESDSRLNYPGLYSETNPLGYYSYRIVVKQQEQEYYNVYTPGALAGNLTWNVSTIERTPPTDSSPLLSDTERLAQLPSFSNIESISMINLFGDNINKVPRELKEVNSNDVTFSSRVLLYNRVNPITNTTSSYNTQSSVSKQGEKVISIEPFRELGDWARTKGDLYPSGDTQSVPQPWYPYFPVPNPPLGDSSDVKYNFYDIFFKSQSNPFIAKIETNFQIGATPTYASQGGIENSWQDLGVFETAPTESVLDIYFESSTSGLISTLDFADAAPAGISDGTNKTVLGQNIQYIHTEGLNSSTSSPQDATLQLNLTDGSLPNPGIITSSFTAQIQNVVDGSGSPRNTDFVITQPTTSTFKIQSVDKEVFLSNSNTQENYTFNLLFTDTSNPSGPLWTGAFPLQLNNCQLQNVAPSFSTAPNSTYTENISFQQQTAIVFPITLNQTPVGSQVKAVNGSANTARNTEQLVFEIIDEPGYANQAENGAADFEIIPDTSTSNINGFLLQTLTQKDDGTSTTWWNEHGQNYDAGGSNIATYRLQLKVTDANGNGITTTSSTFVVDVNVNV